AYRAAGHTVEETYAWLEANVQRYIHWLTVNDLHFLARGGRLSASSATLGSILKIKPVLNVDPNGRLVPRMKVQGRKHSLKALYEQAEKYAVEPHKQTMFISHADSEKDAEWLATRLKEKLGVPEVMISQIGPIVGSHAGPGTVALFFQDRDGAARVEAGTADHYHRQNTRQRFSVAGVFCNAVNCAVRWDGSKHWSAFGSRRTK
ncbi:MAG: DegV family protein, partial [Candidatus Limiplasma sp.]|nr:DegV family protein [Candidatus Limiplasma sp.]